MLIGGHVSPAGGLAERADPGRGDRRRVRSRSSTSHRAPGGPPTTGPSRSPSSREARDRSSIKAVVIHAVYLINCASKDPEIGASRSTSLIHALRLGDAIGADGVVLHPGSTVGEPHEAGDEARRQGLRRGAGRVRSTARCCSRTPPAPATHSGASFDELAELIDLTGGQERLGLCLDCCHMLASGFDITTIDKLTAVIDDCDRIVGNDRLGLPARQRLPDAARLQPRPARRPSRRRARRARDQRVPLRAAVRGPARAARDAWSDTDQDRIAIAGCARRAACAAKAAARKRRARSAASSDVAEVEGVVRCDRGVEETRVDAVERTAVAEVGALDR